MNSTKVILIIFKRGVGVAKLSWELILFKIFSVSLICDWPAYVSYVIQPIREKIDFNPSIADVRINYLKLFLGF